MNLRCQILTLSISGVLFQPAILFADNTQSDNALHVETKTSTSAVYVKQKGEGDALKIEHQGSQGNALQINAKNEDTALWVNQTGSGDAANFGGRVYIGGYDKVTGKDNALSIRATTDYPAVYVGQQGNGDALYLKHQGSQGNALQIDAKSEDTALWVNQTGSGKAAKFEGRVFVGGYDKVTGKDNALSIKATTDYPAVFLGQKGGGDALYLKHQSSRGNAMTIDAKSEGVALLVRQKGTGLAARFKGGISTTGSKRFQIPHPTKRDYELVHACVEGPESAVFYRGEAQLTNGRAIIKLPDYFEALTRKDRRTAQLTPKGKEPYLLSYTDIVDGVFSVYGTKPGGFFSWEVKAVRADIQALKVEVPTDEVK